MSRTVLDDIVANTRRTVEEQKRDVSLSTLKAFMDSAREPRDFTAALAKKTPAVIAECKKKSPSRGVLVADYDPLQLATSYEAGGAAAISVLTDTPYFGGSLEHLSLVSDQVRIPVMRKDFIIDEYQIYEARRWGADSFLLLAGVLDLAALQYFIEIGRELGMEPLVETHTAAQLEMAVQTDAKIIGINNRDLRNMSVSLSHSTSLLSLHADALGDRILVCESGINTPADVRSCQEAGFHAFLVGSALAAHPHPDRAVRELIG